MNLRPFFQVMIFTLTNIRANSLKFDLVDWEGNVTYATYDSFWIDDEIHNYEAHVTGYRGTAGMHVKVLILRVDITFIFFFLNFKKFLYNVYYLLPSNLKFIPLI